MRAIEVATLGGPEVLTLVDRPVPEVGPDSILVKTEAIGVNFIDTYYRSGLYPQSLPFIVGNEVCGTAIEVGAQVSTVRVGDRVVSADAQGTYAEYCLAPAALTATVPDGVASDIAAAALLKGLTAHLLTHSVHHIEDGDVVLLHAGAGGVGLILTQFAVNMGGRVLTTVSTPEKSALARQAGADEVLDYPIDAAEFGSKIKALTGGDGVVAAYDGVGKTTFDASLASLAVRGTLALYGASSGPVPPLDPQRLNAAGSVFLTRPSRIHFVRTYDEFAWRTNELMSAIETGAISVTVGDRYDLGDAVQVHRDLEARKTHGSVILTP